MLGRQGRYSGPDGYLNQYSRDLSVNGGIPKGIDKPSSIFYGLSVEIPSISSSVKMSYVIAKGPTPAALFWWKLTANCSGETFCCKNQKTGNTEQWGKVSVSLDLSVGVEASMPTSGFKADGGIKISGMSTCPAEGVGAKATVVGYFIGGAGIYWSSSQLQLTFPIYPEFKEPQFDWSLSTNAGNNIELILKAGVKGSLEVYGPVGNMYKVI